MKKISYILLTLAAVLSGACRPLGVEVQPGQPEGPELFKILQIQGSGPQTRTSYAGETVFSWTQQDQLSVICNDGFGDFFETFTTTTAAASSGFTASVDPSVVTGPVSGLKKLALYPAGAHSYSDDGTVQSVDYVVPAVRDFRAGEGGHEESALPLFAWGNAYDTYLFANLTGAVKFTFTGLMTSQVKFVFTSNTEKITGSFPLTGLGGSYSNVTWEPVDAADDAERTITYYADVDASGEVSFYIPYPAGTLSAGSSFRLEDAGSGTVLDKHNSLAAIPVEKNRVTALYFRTVPAPPYQFTLSYEWAYFYGDGLITNPECGLYDHNEYVVYSDGSLYVDGEDTGFTNPRNTLVYTIFYLEDFKSQAITAEALDAIRGVFSDVRAAGKKAIVRFAYTRYANDDAPLSTVQEHLLQLKPVFSEYVDIIYLVQAGFIGPWGEWHNSDYFPAWAESANDVYYFEDWAKVIDALLDAVPASRQIALRTPYFKRFYFNVKNSKSRHEWDPILAMGEKGANSRLTFHNDAFRANTDSGRPCDSWTFRPQSAINPDPNLDLDMWESQGEYLATGGESGRYYTELPYSGWTQSGGAINLQHISYLNGSLAQDIMGYWVYEHYAFGAADDEEALSMISNRLGYRLVLSEAEFYFTETGGVIDDSKPMSVRLILENAGSARVINKRPMKLVYLRGGVATVLDENAGDVRDMPSNCGAPVSFTCLFSVPPGGFQSGDQLALWLPDDATGLQHRSVYSIRLANLETPSDASYTGVSWVSSPGSDPTDPAQFTGGYNVFYTFP